jgi:hypothetical protein
MSELWRPTGGEKTEKVIRQYTARALIDSFFFSQGSPALQEWIFHYFRHVYPELWVPHSEEERESVLDVAEPVAAQVLRSHQLHKDVGTKEIGRVAEQLDVLVSVFSSEPRPLPETVQAVAERITFRDEYYRTYKGSRPRNEGGNPHNPRTDRHLSQLCHFGLQGHAAGLPMYTGMFRDVTTFFKTTYDEDLSPGVAIALESVIFLYNESHPEQPPVQYPCPTRG